jgi:hypothetical protein
MKEKTDLFPPHLGKESKTSSELISETYQQRSKTNIFCKKQLKTKNRKILTKQRSKTNKIKQENVLK